MAFICRTALATEVPPISVDSRSWFPPVKNTPLARPKRSSRPGSSAVPPGIEIQRRHASRPHVAEKALVARAGTSRHARRGYDRDVGAVAAGQTDESVQDLRRVLLVLGAPDWNDPSPFAAFGHLACTHASIPRFADAIMPSRREGFSELTNRRRKGCKAELCAAHAECSRQAPRRRRPSRPAGFAGPPPRIRTRR